MHPRFRRRTRLKPHGPQAHAGLEFKHLHEGVTHAGVVHRDTLSPGPTQGPSLETEVMVGKYSSAVKGQLADAIISGAIFFMAENQGSAMDSTSAINRISGNF